MFFFILRRLGVLIPTFFCITLITFSLIRMIPGDPIEVIKWKEIYEILETATDRCEDVANVIEGVTLEHA